MKQKLGQQIIDEIMTRDSITEADKTHLSEMLKQLLESEDDLCINSIAEANRLYAFHSGTFDAPYRRKLIDYITQPENEVFASSSDYHNLLMDMFSMGEYFLALKVCDFALSLTPLNRDLLGDALKACGNSCQFARGDRYLSVAETIPTSLWSDRLFLYCIDFLTEKLQANPFDTATYEKAFGLANEFIANFPYDEHGYNQRAELMLTVNKRDEAIADLEKSIMEIQPDPHNRASELVCAQCCVTLLGLLDDSNDYNRIIQVCDIGLRHTAQTQPSVKLGFLTYRKAEALDAEARREAFRVPDTIIQAMNCYQTAYDLNQDRDYARTIEQRYAELKEHAEKHGFTAPLTRRPLYVEQSE